MSQWGSKNLADQGYSTIQILRNYYGDNMYINTAEEISGIPSSWPGYDLTIGSSGNKVLQMQEQLNVIAEVYSSIPTVYENGYFDEETRTPSKRSSGCSACRFPALWIIRHGTKFSRFMWL